MTEEEQKVDEIPEEKIPEDAKIAPGLRAALNYEQADNQPRRRGAGDESAQRLRDWTPCTRLGKMVNSGEIISMEKAIASF